VQVGRRYGGMCNVLSSCGNWCHNAATRVSYRSVYACCSSPPPSPSAGMDPVMLIIIAAGCGFAAILGLMVVRVRGHKSALRQRAQPAPIPGWLSGRSSVEASSSTVESPLQHGSFDMHTGATPPPSYAGRPRAGAEKEMELVSTLVNAEAAAEQTISSKVSTLRVQLGLEDGPLIEIVQQAVAKLGLGEQVARSNIAKQVDACLAVCMTASAAHQPGMPSPAVPQMAPKFDPETGRLVEQVVHRFDPNTGLPLPKFDPHTGRQNY